MDEIDEALLFVFNLVSLVTQVAVQQSQSNFWKLEKKKSHSRNNHEL